MRKETESPNEVANTPPLVPTGEDLAKLLAMNPLAAAQLEGIVWKRAYAELAASVKDGNG